MVEEQREEQDEQQLEDEEQREVEEEQALFHGEISFVLNDLNFAVD